MYVFAAMYPWNMPLLSYFCLVIGIVYERVHRPTTGLRTTIGAVLATSGTTSTPAIGEMIFSLKQD